MYFVNLSLKLMLTATIILAWGGSSRLVLGTSSQRHFPNTFPKSYEREYTTRISTVTAYSLSPDETDEAPTIGSCNCDLRFQTSPIACPAFIPLGSIVEIDNIFYTCLDRMGIRYRMGYFFDILSDSKANAREFGRQIKEVKIYK